MIIPDSCSAIYRTISSNRTGERKKFKQIFISICILSYSLIAAFFSSKVKTDLPPNDLIQLLSIQYEISFLCFNINLSPQEPHPYITISFTFMPSPELDLDFLSMKYYSIHVKIDFLYAESIFSSSSSGQLCSTSDTCFPGIFTLSFAFLKNHSYSLSRCPISIA